MKRGDIGGWAAARDALKDAYPDLANVDLEAIAREARAGSGAAGPGAPACGGGVAIFSKRIEGSPPPPERLECHRRFADLHLVLEGSEDYWLADTKGLRSLVHFDEDGDVEWFEASGCERMSLAADEWIFIEPGLAHMGGLAEGGVIDKLVLKIPAK